MDRCARMDDDNGCSRHTVCTLTFHHRNAVAASPRLTFHSATCDAGRGGLAVRAVAGKASSKPHPSADRCFIGKKTPPRNPSHLYSCDLAASVNLESRRLWRFQAIGSANMRFGHLDTSQRDPMKQTRDARFEKQNRRYPEPKRTGGGKHSNLEV